MSTPLRCLALIVTILAFMAGSPVQADSEADAAALRKADAAWSKTAQAKDLDAFMKVFHDEGAMLAPHSPIMRGKEAVTQWASMVFTSPGFALAWKPASVELADSGDLGYTIGTYEMTMHDADGNAMTDSGKYMTVWKKQADGSWKVVADMFNTSMPMAQ